MDISRTPQLGSPSVGSLVYSGSDRSSPRSSNDDSPSSFRSRRRAYSSVGSVPSFVWGRRTSFTNEPVTRAQLPPFGIAPFAGFGKNGVRNLKYSVDTVHQEQAYIVVNDEALLQSTARSIVFSADGSAVFEICHGDDGFIIREAHTKRRLVQVTTMRRKQGMLKLPQKQIVSNVDLFCMPTASNVLYRVHEPAVSQNALSLQPSVGGPSLHLEGSFDTGSLDLYVTGNLVPLGSAGRDLLGLFLLDRNRYGVEIRKCTKEEAVLALTAVHVAFLRQSPISLPEHSHEPETSESGTSKSFWRKSADMSRLRSSILGTQKQNRSRRRVWRPNQ